jgi:putative OPT family oligopeptide transporter
MDPSSPGPPAGLPENAYRELKPGETYRPVVPPEAVVPEISLRAVLFGLATNVVFSVAATYVALKVGQGIETAIPISVLAVGVSGLLMRLGYRRSSLLENVAILAVGTTSGIVAGGSVFTMPALFILGLPEAVGLGPVELFLQISLVPLLGAVLGVLFLVPFRRYFVRQMHGKLPFPEATATNEILVTGETGGSHAWVLVYSFLAGAVYDFLSGTARLFSETFTTGRIAPAAVPAISWLRSLGDDFKAVFSLGTGAEFVGLGVVIGVRYASIICAGSFLSGFVLLPLLSPFGLEELRLLNPSIAGTSPEEIFAAIPRNIGIGGIFAAGVLSILKMSPVIATALRQALGGLARGRGAGAGSERTDRDLSYPALAGLGALAAVLLLLYFRFVVMNGLAGAGRLSLVAVLLALGIAFLFTTVSAWAIAMISVTPISGMTVTTIILTAVALLAAGLPHDPRGMLATLLVGGVVCTALSMAGTLVTEFKIGYWLGATPSRIAWGAILSSAIASVCVTATILVLAHQPGYDRAVNPAALPAPQANVMASALESFLGGGRVPWLLYGVGAAVVGLVELVGVSGLAFALGMYLPMELNTPILAGALVAGAIRRSSREPSLLKARSEKAVLIASGLIAGGAIIGVLSNGLVILDDQWEAVDFVAALDGSRLFAAAGLAEETALRASNLLGLVAFLGLCGWVYWDACRGSGRP